MKQIKRAELVRYLRYQAFILEKIADEIESGEDKPQELEHIDLDDFIRLEHGSIEIIK